MQKRLKILYLVRQQGIHSGSSKQLFYLAKEMVARGHEVTCIFNDTPKTPCDHHSLAPLKELKLKFSTLDMGKFYRPRSIKSLRRILKQEQFDVIHTYKGGAVNLAYLASIGIKVPCFVYFRGVSFPLPLLSALKFRGNKIHHIIAISHSIKKSLVEKNRLFADRISVIHGVEDANQYFPMESLKEREQFGLPSPSEGKVIAIFANFGTWKGHKTLFQSAPYFLSKHPDAIIWCVGKGDTSRFTPLLKELGIENRIKFTPFVAKFEKAVASADLSVCASYDGEGLTGTLVCSMAMKKTIVTTDVGGNAEIIKQDKTGIVVPKRNPQALGEAICELLDNPSKCQQLAQNAYDYFITNLQPQQAAAQTEEIYHQILHQHNEMS